MTPYVKRLTSSTLVMLAALLGLTANAFSGDITEVILNKSELIILQKPAKRASIAVPEIAKMVVVSPTEILIIGAKPGETSLIVWDDGGGTHKYDIRVKPDLSRLEQQIRQTAPHDRISVEYANDTLVLSGTATNDQTIAKVIRLAQAYVGKDAGTGTPGGAEQKDKRSTESSTILNLIQVNAPQQVLLEVKVAQVDKSALKSLGVSAILKGVNGEGFSNLVGAPVGESKTITSSGSGGASSSTTTQGTGIVGNIAGLGSFNPLDVYQLGFSLFKPGIGAVLRALVTKNLAKILAEPNLLVKSGQDGRFLAGQKIPVSIVSGVGAISGTTIQYIDVGVKLNFKPEVMENGLISLTIDPAEVSNIAGYLQTNGYPIIDTREVRTTVQLKDGESLVLAGLLQEETIKVLSKIPLAGDIPILGALFRSTQDDLREKELVFFITPRLVTANAPGVKTTLPTDAPLTPEQEEEFRWIPRIWPKPVTPVQPEAKTDQPAALPLAPEQKHENIQ